MSSAWNNFWHIMCAQKWSLLSAMACFFELHLTRSTFLSSVSTKSLKWHLCSRWNSETFHQPLRVSSKYTYPETGLGSFSDWHFLISINTPWSRAVKGAGHRPGCLSSSELHLFLTLTQALYTPVQAHHHQLRTGESSPAWAWPRKCTPHPGLLGMTTCSCKGHQQIEHFLIPCEFEAKP